MLKPKSLGIRTICLLLLCVMAVLLFSIVPSASASEETQEVPSDIVVCQVHLYANSGSLVIGMIQQGTELTVRGESGQFYKIDLSGMNGYIAKSQVRQDDDGRYFVACVSGAVDTTTMHVDTAETVSDMRRSIIKLAIKQLGTRYVWGGSYPGGFDCSGLTTYVYTTSGREINRNALTQMSEGLVVAEEDLQPGDLVFYRDTGRWGGLASHVGMYVGDGKMIHADSAGVRVTELSYTYYYNRYIGARRVLIPDVPVQHEETEAEENWWETPVNTTGALFYADIP